MTVPGRTLSIEEIGDDVIMDAATEAAKAAGEDIPKTHQLDDPIDPAKVAADLDAPDDEDDDKKEETADEKAAREKAEAEAEVYIPEDPKPKGEPKDPETPDPAKPAGVKGNPEAEADEVAAFVAQMKADGFEEDSIKAFQKAVELGGTLALKRFEKQRTEEAKRINDEADEAKQSFATQLHGEYVAIGNLQKSGVLPKVPVATQKKLVEGQPLTQAELEHPGVKRQNEVWGHMKTTNAEAIARGERPYLLNFRSALTDLRQAEADKATAAKEKTATDKKKDQSKLFGGGAGGGTGDKGAGAAKPYVRGQSLDDVTQEILNELNAT